MYCVIPAKAGIQSAEFGTWIPGVPRTTQNIVTSIFLILCRFLILNSIQKK